MNVIEFYRDALHSLQESISESLLERSMDLYETTSRHSSYSYHLFVITLTPRPAPTGTKAIFPTSPSPFVSASMTFVAPKRCVLSEPSSVLLPRKLLLAKYTESLVRLLMYPRTGGARHR